MMIICRSVLGIVHIEMAWWKLDKVGFRLGFVLVDFFFCLCCAEKVVILFTISF